MPQLQLLKAMAHNDWTAVFWLTPRLAAVSHHFTQLSWLHHLTTANLRDSLNSILSAAWDPCYIASEWPPQKTPFPTIPILLCLQSCCLAINYSGYQASCHNINNVPATTGTHFALFTDDACIYTTKKHERRVLCTLQHGLTAVRSWCECWNISINEEKTVTENCILVTVLRHGWVLCKIQCRFKDKITF
jgi:hypothetical protein